MDHSNSRCRPLDLIAMAATSIVCGAVIGASTNAVNGALSPAYFRTVMRWQEVEQIWRASIAQGILEGLIYGVLFAIVFTLVVGRVSQARCPFTFALRSLCAMSIGIYCCWAIGGLLAMFLATLSPEFYRSTFYGVPDEFGSMLRYAWVGGSIWGALSGSVLALATGSVLFSVRWKNSQFETLHKINE